MSHTWFLLGLVECSHNGVNRRQQTNTVKNNNLPLERESRSFAEISTPNVEQMQWWWLEGLLSGWRGRLGRTVVAPCPPEFSCTDQGWRVNPEDVSPTHQSNITPVEPTGKAKSFSTFLSWFSCEDFSRDDYENQKNISTSHLKLDPKKWKTKC